MSVLSVSNLEKSFGTNSKSKKKKVLNKLSFDVPAGKITGFLGGNGAGKTTALNCIFDFLKKDSGEVSFFNGKPLNSELKKKIGYLPERNFSFDTLSALEFISISIRLSLNISKRDANSRAVEGLESVGLGFAMNQRLRSFSKGMLQKVGLIQAMIHQPEFIVLDEPMSGLDPDGRQIISKQIIEANERGASIFFSSHILSDVEKLCSNLIIVKQGAVIFSGLTEELIASTTASYCVDWQTRDNVKSETLFASLETANQNIAEIISQGGRVQSLRPVRPTLEQVFVKLAIHPSESLENG